MSLIFPLFSQVPGKKISWFDPREEPFELIGFEWIKQDGEYRRLPLYPDWEIRDAMARKGSTYYKDWIQLRDFQRKLVDERKSSGDKQIYFLDGSNILGKDYDECTVDGVHPNDLGSKRIADGLKPFLESILMNNPVPAL
jgi:hypothetical protein